MAITDVMVAIEIACRENGQVRLLREDEIPLPETARRKEPFQWKVTLAGRHKLGVIPDRVFGLEFIGTVGKPARAYFFLEADRGTMPVIRQNLTQSSFYRKMLAYEATWTQNLHRTRLGLHRFRVLTVTSTPARVKTLADACRELGRGKGLFLFTDIDSFLNSAQSLELLWSSASAELTESLLDSLSTGHLLKS